jgi:hypothetical protein
LIFPQIFAIIYIVKKEKGGKGMNLVFTPYYEDELSFCKIGGCEALRDGCWKNCPYAVKEEEESEAK